MYSASFRQAKRLFLAVLAGTILAFPTAAQAQEAMAVTGRVTDETGEPLGTVNVYLDGTDLATITDGTGAYSLVVPASRIDQQQHVLIAGLIGYRSGQETIMLLGDALTVDFVLQLDPIGLDEIVAVGQGLTRQRRRLGSTVNSISATDIELARETNAVDAIAGKAPNVNVVRSTGDPGGGTYINVRGAKSIQGGSQPLFVIDGTPVNNQSLAIENIGDGSPGNDDTVDGTAVGNRANDINPDDIESIEILKGPAGSAIYGSQGANGVVLITTKSGSGTGGVNADLRFAFGPSNVSEFNDLQTSWSQGSGGVQSASSGSWGEQLDPGTPTFAHGGELFKTGMEYDVNLTLSGGNNRTTYFFSGGYTRQNGVIRGNSKNDRFNVRLKASQQFLDNLSVTGNLAYTNQATDLIQVGSNTSGMLLGAFRTPPEFNNLPWLDEETGLHRSYRCNTTALSNAGPACGSNPRQSRRYDNPFWIANEILNTANVDRTFGNLRLDWDPYSWLNVSNIFGIDNTGDSRFTLFPPSSGTFAQGRIIRASLNTFDIDNSLWLTAQGSLSSSIFAGLSVGQNVRQRDFSRFQTTGENINAAVIPSVDGIVDLESTVTRTPTEYNSQVRTVGYFAEANIDIGDQLFVTGGVRYDGWSTFGSGQQWYWFPSGSAAWEFTRHLTDDGSGGFSFGKVRVAYGEAGQAPPVYSNLSSFAPTTFTDGWLSPVGIESNFMGQAGVATEFVQGNDAIGPERTKEFEAGIELAFVDSRISFSGVYFQQKTVDAILNLPAAPSTGFDAIPINAGEFENNGWEVQLGLVPFRGRSFTWEIDAHAGWLDSKVVDLEGAEEFVLNGFSGTHTSVIQDICGPGADEECDFGVLFTQDALRFGRGNTADVDCNAATPVASIDDAFPQAPAGALYIGCDGYGFNDGQLRNTGNPNADWNGGVRNTFSIMENLRISALIDWRSNLDMWNGTRGALFFFGAHADTDSWHGDGQPFVFDGFGPGAGTEVLLDQNYSQNLIGSGFSTGGPGGGDIGDGFIETASFVKLRDVSLRYSLPGGVVSRFLGFGRAEFSFTARNLVTWTDYRGLDPESNLTGQSTGRGLEYFNNPRVRSYIFQINLVR